MRIFSFLVFNLLAVPVWADDNHNSENLAAEARASARDENLTALRNSMDRYQRAIETPKNGRGLEIQQRREIADFVKRLREALATTSLDPKVATQFLEELENMNLKRLRTYNLEVGGPLTWIQHRLSEAVAATGDSY